jgi:membrane protein implicated in regulation of membrane protease activity
MEQSSIWWLLAGGAVAVELMTGTFYLLMLALGMAAGAIAAHLGLGTTGQLLVAAVVGAGTTLTWRAVRQSHGAPAHANSNRDVNLDIGETVQVDAWQPDGTASVNYRGARWSVAHRTNPANTASGAAAATPGLHRIVEVVGNRFGVEKI